MEQAPQFKNIQEEVKRLSDDMTFILGVMTDPEFNDEDREFYLRTRQAQREVEQGKVATYSENEFKKRWKIA